jgi:hypothetical protein
LLSWETRLFCLLGAILFDGAGGNGGGGGNGGDAVIFDPSILPGFVWFIDGLSFWDVIRVGAITAGDSILSFQTTPLPYISNIAPCCDGKLARANSESQKIPSFEELGERILKNTTARRAMSQKQGNTSYRCMEEHTPLLPGVLNSVRSSLCTSAANLCETSRTTLA